MSINPDPYLPGRTPPDERTQIEQAARLRQTRAGLAGFLKRLRKDHKFIETVEIWTSFVTPLLGFLHDRRDVIPEVRYQALLTATKLSEPTRAGILQACRVLQFELEETLQLLPVDRRTRLITILPRSKLVGFSMLGLLLAVAALIVYTLYLLRPVQVSIYNNNCIPSIPLASAVPEELQPLVKALGVVLPERINKNDAGIVEVPAVPVTVSLESAPNGSTLTLSIMGVSTPLYIPQSNIEVSINGEPLTTEPTTLYLWEQDWHDIIITCR